MFVYINVSTLLRHTQRFHNIKQLLSSKYKQVQISSNIISSNCVCCKLFTRNYITKICLRNFSHEHKGLFEYKTKNAKFLL